MATGVGSMPGTEPREAQRVILGELPDLPHLPELPARGPGSDLVGRGAALLVDLSVQLEPAGWRLADRPGLDTRRARSWLREDLDAAEELGRELDGPFKVQAAGPWTLAASLEMRRRGPVLGDHRAVRDVAASLSEGVALHVADVRRRLPDARVVLQLDEPSLPAVLQGRVPTPSGWGRVGPVDESTAEQVLGAVLQAARDAGAVPVVHCCAAAAPLGLLRRSGVAAVSLDAGLLSPSDDECLGEAMDGGTNLVLGIDPVSEPADSVRAVQQIRRRLGIDGEQFAGAVALSAACGLAAASPAAARAALANVRAAASLLRDELEGQ